MADKTTGELQVVQVQDLPGVEDVYDTLKIPGELQGGAVHFTGNQIKQYAQNATRGFAESASADAATAVGAKTAAQSALAGVQAALNNLPAGDTLIINDLTTGGTAAALSAEMGKVLGIRPNPNLLHNWHFGNPVNQRGQTEYTGAVYGIDRWAGANSRTNVSVVTDGIGLKSSTTAYAYLDQMLEHPSQYLGSAVTVSALIDGELLVANVNLPEELPTTVTTLAMNENAAKTAAVHLLTMGNGDIRVRLVALDSVVKAAKLELGDAQTLAHQDSNGAWVLNEIPDYGEELAKCQRYFLAVNPDPFGTGYTVGGGSNADILIPTTQTMRAKPTLVTDGTFKVRVNGSDYTASSTNVQMVSGNCVEIRFVVPGSPAACAATGYLSGATYFYLDANL